MNDLDDGKSIEDLEEEIAELDRTWLGGDEAAAVVAPEEPQVVADAGPAVEQYVDPDLAVEEAKMDGKPQPVPLEHRPLQGPVQEGEPAVPLEERPLEGPIQEREVPKEPWAAIKHGLRENETRPPPPSALVGKMKSVGWEPREAPSPEKRKRDWATLQKDLQDAERGAESSRVIGTMLHAVAPGLQPPANAGQGHIDSAKAAITAHEGLLAESRQQDLDAENRKRAALEQERQRQQIDLAKAQADTAAKAKLVAEAKEQERNDPNSVASKNARAALRGVYELAGGVPDGFDAWSAAEVEKHAKTLVPVATGSEARKKTAAETAAKAAAADAEAKSLEGEKEALAADKRLAKLGVTPEMLAQMDRHAIDKVRAQLGTLKAGAGTGGPAKAVHKLEDIPDPGDRAKVQAIGEGRADVTIAGLKDRGRIASLVMQVYPDYDQTKFGAYKAVVQKQATDKEIVAAEVARDHFRHARQNLPKTNFDAPVMNRLRKAILTGTGDPQMTPFEVDVKVAADEYAKALGNNAQAGRQEVEHLFASAQSPAQLEAALNEAEALLDSKIHAWTNQREKVRPGGRTEAGHEAAAPLKTRKQKNGEDAFSKDGKRWFTTREEAEAN